MRVIALNANGIRAAARKGFFGWLPKQKADFVCIQETKAQNHQLTDPIFRPPGWHSFYGDATIKKGYSGVAIYTPHQPVRVHYKLGHDLFDQEGRYLQVDYDHLSVISLYLPSGTSGDIRQNIKYEILDWILPKMEAIRDQGREVVWCGDFNIAHRPIDLKNDKSNQKNSGFLPEERAWLDKLFSAGYHDNFRILHPDREEYTWWSNRGRAWDNNVGWRIDYQIATEKLANSITDSEIYRDERFSDHAPLIMDYDFPTP